MQLTTLSILWGGTSEPPGGLYAEPHPPSLFMFWQLLPDEAPEVTYETAIHFASTMVEFQTRI